MDFFSPNELPQKFQHIDMAFQQILHMTEEWLTCLDKRKLIGVVFVQHLMSTLGGRSPLIAKLQAYDFLQSALALMHRYLSNRFFYGIVSNSITSCCLAQGSCLGPLLFSIFINDFPYVKKASVMYADDATMFTAASTTPEFNGSLQHQSNTVVD